MNNTYQICTRCVMDNKSDKTICFDSNGVCNYCTDQFAKMDKIYFPGQKGVERLTRELDEIKKSSKGKKYDCLMGISGGLDSSYLAYLGAKKWGLRILAVHVDDGFDTEISKRNIEKLVDSCGFDYHVITPDAEQYNALTVAYMRAGVPNLAIPQDNVLFAELYKIAKKEGLKYFLSGGNFALECVLQKGNTYDAYDYRNIKAINKIYGIKGIDKLQFISNAELDINRSIRGIQTVRLLNYINYNRLQALKELADECGFEYYGSKHLENTLTKFIQLYWFPVRFDVDKRRSHYSSMIVSGQMKREEAVQLLEQPIYNEEDMKETINEVIHKLGLTQEEFDEIMKMPNHQHTDFNTSIYKKLRLGLAKLLKH